MDSVVVVLSQVGHEGILTALGQGSYKTIIKSKLPAALKVLTGREVVIIDRGFGRDALGDILAYHPEAIVIQLTDQGCDEHQLIDAGAYECVDYPLSRHRLRAAVRNAFRLLRAREELSALKGERRMPPFFKSRNRQMQRLVRQIEEASAVNDPVLIKGENGSGRALVAKLIHASSPSRVTAFISAEPIVDGMEAELFGTLTGRELVEGLVHKAEGGTLYLGNVGAISEEFSKQLTALLGRRVFMPVGSPAEARSDARMICSISTEPVGQGLLDVFPIVLSIPSLRERKEDIMPLAEVFLDEAALEFGTGRQRFTKGSKKLLMEYAWPGNIKELKYAVRKAALLSDGAKIEERHLGMPGAFAHVTMKEFLSAKLTGYIRSMAGGGRSGIHSTVIEEVEKALIEIALAETSGNQVRAAQALGITRVTLRSKIKSYGIKAPASLIMKP